MVDRNRIRAIAARQGLKAIKLGMRLNTAYTPKNCMRAATEITGKAFKARDYDGAINALTEWLEDSDVQMVRDRVATEYGDAGTSALETSCVTRADCAKGYDHVLSMILPALEEELIAEGDD